LHLKPKDTTEQINFTKLRSLMLSKDTTRTDEYRTMIQSELKFLDKKDPLKGIAFVSFPRTGNSFLRKILEQCTGIFTGADMPLDITLSIQQQGLLGE